VVVILIAGWNQDQTVDSFLDQSLNGLAFVVDVFIGVRDNCLITMLFCGIDDGLGRSIKECVCEVGDDY
jgi:hypothetical protein